MEAGEGAEEALVREIREELGCEVNVGAALETVEHEYGELRIRLRPYLCALAEEEPQALEHAALVWERLESLGNRRLAAADLKVADQLS